MKTKLTILIPVLLATAGLLLLLPPIRAQQSGTGAASESYPAMRNALHDLETARMRLSAAKHEFGGHREAALKHCDEAIKEIQAGLKFAEEHEKH
jgi:hypothetical protein